MLCKKWAEEDVGDGTREIGLIAMRVLSFVESQFPNNS
jgi:hypothetical protein